MLFYQIVDEVISCTFLTKGANVDDIDKYLVTPLHEAVKNGHSSIVKLLIENNANVNALGGWSRSTALHLVNDLQITRLLLEAGADVTIRKTRDETALHTAAISDADQIMNILIRNGADVNSKDYRGRTPLHLAAENGAAKAARVLLNNNANVNATFDKGKTSLHVAATHGSAPKIVKVLLASGANIDSKTTIYRWTPLLTAIRFGRLEISRLLINNGADVNAVDREGQRPLHMASEKGKVGIVKLLIKSGANVNATTYHEEETPLHKAVIHGIYNRDENWKQSSKIIGHLYDAGADMNAQRKDGQTPLSIALQKGRKGLGTNVIVEYLRSHDAKE